MRIQEAYQLLRQNLVPLYEDREAAAIASMVIEHITGYARSARLVHGEEELTQAQLDRLSQGQQELLAWRPVQYVLNEAWFAGMAFQVDERVLIPRPETEELVDWIVKTCCRQGLSTTTKTTVINRTAESGGATVQASVQDQMSGEPLRILDIGTGSGCIAIALKKKCTQAHVFALDKSAEALDLARVNAETLRADLTFLQLDILDPVAADRLPELDIIVSNPPYVPHRDAQEMRPNVRAYEPSLALFVDDEDPLLFYRVIAETGLLKLRPGGRIFFEIHVEAGKSIVTLLQSLGYREVELRQDLSGLDRMVSAIRP